MMRDLKPPISNDFNPINDTLSKIEEFLRNLAHEYENCLYKLLDDKDSAKYIE